MSAASIAWTVLNVGMIILVGVIGAGIMGVLVWAYLKHKKYNQYKCVIWETDTYGNCKESYDKAGIFVDNKTKNKRFFLRKANVGLDPNTVPYLQSGNSRTVYLLRDGLKNFRFLNMNVWKKPNPGFSNVNISVGEEDVNWAINAYERQKRLFSHNLFMQYLPFIALAFVSIIILVIFIYFFKNFESLRALGAAMTETAKIMAQAQTGTTVIGG